jgi:hypothetical protein
MSSFVGVVGIGAFQSGEHEGDEGAGDVRSAAATPGFKPQRWLLGAKRSPRTFNLNPALSETASTRSPDFLHR